MGEWENGSINSVILREKLSVTPCLKEQVKVKVKVKIKVKVKVKERIYENSD
jgi:hypothetical protein